MKNIFRILMAVAVLFTASCAKEDISSSIASGEANVTFTVDLPELGTRAYGEGNHATKLKFFVYEYQDENSIGKYLPNVLMYNANNEGTNVITSTNKRFDFSLTLIKGMKYNIVFWADKGEFSPYAPEYVNGVPTGVIKANYSDVYANDDTLDAFFGSLKNFDPAAADAQSKAGKVELKRPFAQLNAKTTDLTEIQRSGATLTKSALTVKAYTTLDLFSGNVGGLDEDNAVVFKSNLLPDNNGHISMNYLLAPATKCTADVTLSYTFEGANVNFPAATYSYVPLQRNYKTNIIGKLLTASTDFIVEIKPGFEEPDQAPEALFLAAANGGEVTLTEDVVLTQPLNVQSTMTLDLNGHTISTTEESTGRHYYAFENHGTLTIKDTYGDGVINARGIFNYGALTLENGTINAIDGNGGYAIRNYEGATFTMNGGTIATTYEDDNLVDKGGNDATPLRVDEGATAVINGGTINNICDFTFAIDNYGNTTVKGGTFTSIHSTVSTYGVMTIDGGSFTCNGKEGISSHALVAWAGSKTTINGGSLDGKDNNNGYNVYAAADATVNITGGEFLPVYSGSLYGDGTITVSGGTFFDKIKDSRLAQGYETVVKYNGIYVVPQLVADLYNVTTATTVEFTENLNVATGATIHTQGATAAITINGNGKSVVSSANSEDDFQWENGKFPAMSTILSSQNGEKVTVSNLTFEGTMSALMLGHYVSNTKSDWYNTELNNVNVVNTKVVSFSENIAPAVCVYGKATLNDCNVYGTTLSKLETAPMWPVYDIAVVNDAVLTLNNSKVGSIIAWAKSKIVVEAGSVVESIKPIHTSMNANEKYGVVVKKDATVNVLDLTNIAQPTKKINITVEDGAKIGKVVANGVEYPSVKEYLDTTPVKNADELVAALKAGTEVVVAAGSYTFPSSDVKAGAVIRCEEGTVFTGNSKLNIKGATVIGATFSNPSGTAVDQTINGTFKNCTFEGSNALRYCYVGETCVFENCDFSGSTYGVHFDGGTAKNLVFRNCTISGFNAFAGAIGMVTFEGCTFAGNGKSGYNGANLWGSAKMVNCEFTFDGSTANEWIDCIGADKTYEFTNCTVNGVAYTAENHADYNIFSSNDATVKINGVDFQL